MEIPRVVYKSAYTTQYVIRRGEVIKVNGKYVYRERDVTCHSISFRRPKREAKGSES